MAQAEVLTIMAPEDKTFTAYNKLTPLTTRHYGVATATTDDGESVTPTHDAPRHFPLGTTTTTWAATTPTAEPVHGTLAASAWAVGGARALGAAPADGAGAPEATLAIPPQAPVRSIVLTHPPLAGTGEAPAVAYSPA